MNKWLNVKKKAILRKWVLFHSVITQIILLMLSVCVLTINPVRLLILLLQREKERKLIFLLLFGLIGIFFILFFCWKWKELIMWNFQRDCILNKYMQVNGRLYWSKHHFPLIWPYNICAHENKLIFLQSCISLHIRSVIVKARNECKK